jgi:hypothetical protein
MSWLAPLASLASPLIAGLFGGNDDNEPKIRNQSLLSKEQQPLLQQAISAGLRPGAGGAFGQAADYYRNNLSNNPNDFAAFAAPELRRYNEDIIPGLSEQFAGMGAGGLSSSGFRNAQVQGATDLAERLGSLRAQLRQNSAQGLSNIGQVGLGNFSENVMNQPQPNFGQSFAGGFGQAAGRALPSLFSSWGSSGGLGDNVGGSTNPYSSATASIRASP